MKKKIVQRDKPQISELWSLNVINIVQDLIIIKFINDWRNVVAGYLIFVYI